MKITHFVHTDVSPDGLVPTGGAVVVDGRVGYSAPDGGCGSEGCNCSPGHWFSKVHPRTPDGVVFGYTAHFSSREEMLSADQDLIDQEARNLLN